MWCVIVGIYGILGVIVYVDLLMWLIVLYVGNGFEIDENIGVYGFNFDCFIDVDICMMGFCIDVVIVDKGR